jgi:S-adenosylmethionine decarboxylase proenzyme
MKTQSLGNHVTLDFYGCEADNLDNPEFVRDSLLKAINLAGCTYVEDSFKEFEPIGVSGFVIIAESHLSIHTWPEHKFAALDVFTCGHIDQLYNIEKHLTEIFSPNMVDKTFIKRGTRVHTT